MREPVMTADGIRWVPCLSGNAIRHRVLRRPAMLDLIQRWDLSGKLTVAQLNFLLHGGSLTEKGGRVSVADQIECFRCFPILRLLGCSLPGQIVPGSLQVWRGILVCRENAERLRQILPGDFPLPTALRPAVTQISDYLYTRSDASKSAPDVRTTDGQPGDSNLMMYEGQAVAAGAVFLHGFTITSATEIELGAFFAALRLWRQSGGTIGGMSSKGHGRLDTLYWLPSDVDETDLIAQYQAAAEALREDALRFLDRIFHVGEFAAAETDADASEAGESGEDKPKRGRRKKAEASA